MSEIEVNSRITFIEFVKKLRGDLHNNQSDWENVNLIDFLEALERYTTDIHGFYKNTGQLDENADEASWKRFADILKGAKFYE